MDKNEFDKLCEDLEISLDDYKNFDKDNLEGHIDKLLKKLEETKIKIKRPEFVWNPDLGELRNKCERVIDQVVRRDKQMV